MDKNLLKTPFSIVFGVAVLSAALSPLSYAVTPPALQLSDTAGNIATIDSTGTVVFSGACTPASCSTQSVSVGTGVIVWTGTIGAFTVIPVDGASTISSPTGIGMNFGMETAAAGGALTLKYTSTGFDGSGPVTFFVSNSTSPGVSATFTSYVDSSNTPFGAATLVGTLGIAGGTVTGPGPSNQPFSMTEVAVVTMAPNSFISVGAANTTATPPPPLTLGCSVATGTVGVPYNSSLNPMGGFPPYTFSITMGSLPPVLNLNPSTGAIAGTPTTAGTFNFTAQVVDSSGNVAINTKSVGCSIVIAPSIPPLKLTCPASTGQVGVAYSSALVATGGVKPYTFSISTGALPLILNLDSTTGAITGTPTSAGTFNFTAKVVDSSGNISSNSQTANCSIVVSPSTPLGRGDTATIGFWHNKNGQALINCVNGGSTATALATWLATNFPNLYGATSSNNLTGKTNADVAALFLSFFGVSGPKTYAQILAGALAAYVTDSTLAGGTCAAPYGFNISTTGTGAKTFNTGTNGTAIGLLNNTNYTIDQLLAAANAAVPLSPAAFNALNNIFDGINQGGDIS